MGYLEKYLKIGEKRFQDKNIGTTGKLKQILFGEISPFVESSKDLNIQISQVKEIKEANLKRSE